MTFLQDTHVLYHLWRKEHRQRNVQGRTGTHVRPGFARCTVRLILHRTAPRQRSVEHRLECVHIGFEVCQASRHLTGRTVGAGGIGGYAVAPFLPDTLSRAGADILQLCTDATDIGVKVAHILDFFQSRLARFFELRPGVRVLCRLHLPVDSGDLLLKLAPVDRRPGSVR
jgi:hypothetical protein